jgi:hypothetical protein
MCMYICVRESVASVTVCALFLECLCNVYVVRKRGAEIRRLKDGVCACVSFNVK